MSFFQGFFTNGFDLLQGGMRLSISKIKVGLNTVVNTTFFKNNICSGVFLKLNILVDPS